jgi:hypothetical protein
LFRNFLVKRTAFDIIFLFPRQLSEPPMQFPYAR